MMEMTPEPLDATHSAFYSESGRCVVCGSQYPSHAKTCEIVRLTTELEIERKAAAQASRNAQAQINELDDRVQTLTAELEAAKRERDRERVWLGDHRAAFAAERAWRDQAEARVREVEEDNARLREELQQAIDKIAEEQAEARRMVHQGATRVREVEAENARLRAAIGEATANLQVEGWMKHTPAIRATLELFAALSAPSHDVVGMCEVCGRPMAAYGCCTLSQQDAETTKGRTLTLGDAIYYGDDGPPQGAETDK